MKLGQIVVASFLFSFILSLVGAYLKITHSEGADGWLLSGILAFFVFIATAIYEVRTSRRIDPTEKKVWTLALLFFSGIAGLIYILIGRKRIATVD